VPRGADIDAPCLECEIVAGRERPPGGIVLRDGAFVVHGLADAATVRGWVVVGTVRHVRALYDLDDAEAAALGPLLVRIQRAQRRALGAEHAYVLAIGDALHHAHVHVVPRFSDTPAHLRGARVLQASIADARPVDEVEAACLALATALRDAPASPARP
jgi:diadenosine tetraphosphate (Ap4A) HIT family hydrolase